MAWIRLGQEMVLERLAVSAMAYAQAGMFGALGMAILPLFSKVLKLCPCRKHGARTGGRTC